MKDVACYNCGSDNYTFYASENGFTLVKCSACGLLFVNPRPDDREIEVAHRLGVHRGDKQFSVTGRFNPRKVSTYVKILHDFYGGELLNGQRRWLDIGCGHGEFLIALKRYSNNEIVCKGIEPNIA